MLQTVEAIVDPSGTVRLLERLRVDHPARAVVTLIDIAAETPATGAGNSDDILRFLEQSRLPTADRLSAAEIDAQIKAERDAWD